MVKTIATFLFAIVICFSGMAGTLFPNLDINDPNLSQDKVMRQCQKSLMYAPQELDAWCDKAYKMGNWQALELVGLHKGDGSRYIAEAKKHAAEGDPDGILALAYVYSTGRFVTKDLYLIYTELGDLEKAAAHKRFLDESNYEKVRKEMFEKQLKDSGISLDN
ncbi:MULTISPECIES: hypothetical protein [unclassified Pseudoalteromonas]|uniref:hypothetical protein n=1 Tax=unclassified Pseudoalteromonas TaxID=194690 RepID=UPI00257EBC0E|nr:hypothetical protein [Pseudoalteromonas sp. UBA2102]|tara:strand:- start:487 stop:975 length:489 start_codon:yes stop_codon:yes gene_type:complete